MEAHSIRLQLCRNVTRLVPREVRLDDEAINDRVIYLRKITDGRQALYIVIVE